MDVISPSSYTITWKRYKKDIDMKVVNNFFKAKRNYLNSVSSPVEDIYNHVVSTLQIENANYLEHDGEYECIGKNYATLSRAQINIRIQGWQPP